METLEIQVKNVSEATATVAAQLGVDPSEITVTVIDESPGLFGKKKLKVQVERGDEKPAKPSKTAKPKAEAKPEAKPARGKAAKVEAPAEEEAEPEVEAAPAKPARGAKAKPEPKAKPAKAVVAPVAASEAGEEGDAPEVVATQEDADDILDILDGILAAADFEAEARVTGIQGRYVNIEIDGKDASHLVGKSGEVLNSFQYVTNLIVTRQLNRGVRVTLDGNNYRSRREEVLRGFATQIAEQVIARGEEAVFEALPAFERRIVHQVLQEIDGVTTYSEGEEPNRCIVIAPA